MRKLAAFTVLWLSLMVAPAMAMPLPPLLATQHVVVALRGVGYETPKSVPRVFMTFRPSKAGVTIPHGYIRSYADFHKFAADHTIPTGTTVMFDIELWRFTPRTERHAPLGYMRRFVALAHKRRLTAILCPSKHFLPQAASVQSDAFLVQEYLPGGRELSSIMASVMRRQRGQVYFKLAAHVGVDLPYLLSEWRTVRKYTTNLVLWGARDKASTAALAEFVALGVNT